MVQTTRSNHLDDEILAKDLAKRIEEIENANIAESLSILKIYEINRELKLSTLLITEKEAKIRAARMFLKLVSANLVDNFGRICPGILEAIEGV